MHELKLIFNFKKLLELSHSVRSLKTIKYFKVDFTRISFQLIFKGIFETTSKYQSYVENLQNHFKTSKINDLVLGWKLIEKKLQNI